MEKLRQSNFELLRVVAMLFILCYHQVIYYVLPTIGDSSLFQGMQLTLHTGVLLFVLISGYFGIHPTVSGGVNC